MSLGWIVGLRSACGTWAYRGRALREGLSKKMSLSNEILLYIKQSHFSLWISRLGFSSKLQSSNNTNGAKQSSKVYQQITVVRKKWKSILLESLLGNFPQNFSRIYILFPMRFFMKSPTIRCRAVVGGIAASYFFLMLLKHNPAWLCTLFVVSLGWSAVEIMVLYFLWFVLYSLSNGLFFIPFLTIITIFLSCFYMTRVSANLCFFLTAMQTVLFIMMHKYFFKRFRGSK